MYEYDQIVKDINKLKKDSAEFDIQLLKYSEPVKSLSEEEIEEILNNPGQREQYLRTKKEFEVLKTDIATLKQQEKTLIARLEDLGELESLTAYDEDFLLKESDICDGLRKKVKNWKMILDRSILERLTLGLIMKSPTNSLMHYLNFSLGF